MGLGNGLDGVAVGGANNIIGGTTAGARNVDSANGNVSQAGVQVSGTGDVVEGNYIGTNAAGTAKLSNNYGVFVYGGDYTTIGGTTAGARNIISGNGQGLFIEGGSNTLIEGNHIGLDPSGTTAVGNIYKGILAGYGGSNLQIGGTVAGAGNVISGNGEDGIYLDVNVPTAVIQGNLIGTDWTGTVGVVIYAASP